MENRFKAIILSSHRCNYKIKMKNKKYAIYATVVLAVVILVIVIWKIKAAKETEGLVIPVKKGKLEITVTTTGELEALNSEDIKGPMGLRSANLWQVKISDLIPEGSIVKAGDYIATLDRSEATQKMKDISGELSKIESQFTQTRLDTALEMRKLRDDLVNLKFEMEEKKLVLEESKYEPPSVIRQVQIDLERADRNYKQSLTNYKLKFQQNKAKMQEVSATLSQQQAKLDQIVELIDQFVVKAPKDGMLIYKKDWGGRKIKTGSMISAWDLSVATLPDLSTMVSKTYVNEIDINKIKKNQSVEVRIDAFPDKKFKGKVISIANVGEQLPDNDTKLFEVGIELLDQDTTLRPAMTTSNSILAERLPETLYLPIDAVQVTDSLSFVYLKKQGKIVRKQIITGLSNVDFIQIKEGLEEKDEVVSGISEQDAKELKWILLDKKGTRLSTSLKK